MFQYQILKVYALSVVVVELFMSRCVVWLSKEQQQLHPGTYKNDISLCGLLFDATATVQNDKKSIGESLTVAILP